MGRSSVGVELKSFCRLLLYLNKISRGVNVNNMYLLSINRDFHGVTSLDFHGFTVFQVSNESDNLVNLGFLGGNKKNDAMPG